jgi:hypothetical protein
MSWVFVPGLAGSSSESALPCPERAASLTWRGKPMPPRTLSRAWATGHSIRRLCGLTLPPLTLEVGVASWIASLREIPASLTASPESGSEPTTTGSSSTRCCASSRSAGLVVSSARTSQGTRTDSLRHSSRLWSGWATALRQEYSVRPRPVPATDESDCSSWPTARAEDSESAGRRHGRDVSDTLTAASRDFAAMWPTLMAGSPGTDTYNAAGNSDFSRKAMDLAANIWPTPRTITGGAESAGRKRELGRTKSGGGDLQSAVQLWPTPAARDHKGANSADHVTTNGTGRMYMDQLPNFVAHPPGCPSSPPAPATIAGQPSSPERRSLNPLFVEWLMGWPIGWTDCERAETGLSLWLLRSRGALSTLCSPSTAPDQPSLF